MNIAGLVLHPRAARQLDELLASPTHAVLLSGPAGSGKTHVAEALAASLLGSEVATLENHAYYRVLAPGGSAAGGSISIEQIRELSGFFRLKVPGNAPIERVAVIQDADSMSAEAQNALLKLLEEPPVGSVLILTSSQPGRLLQTIRSRLQLLRLPTPEHEALMAHFTAAGFEAAAVQAALLRSGSNLAEAQAALVGGDNTATDTVPLVKQALSGSSYDRLLLVDGLAKQKEAARAFVDTLATIAAASLDAAAAKRAASIERWTAILQAAHTAQEALSRSGNSKLVLTELMLAL
jgi:DNA polymerase-3 subunit delta'